MADAVAKKNLIGTRRFRAFLVICVALFVGAAGALPHLFFSFDTEKFDFFEGAWDESFYALVMSGGTANWNDYPLRNWAALLLRTTGGANFFSAVLSDIVWPVAVAASAGFLVLTIVRGWLAVIPLVVCLVFASDILAFNSSAIYPPYMMVTAGLKLFSLDLRKLFSDPQVSFLYVYRTPEPQLSLPFLFFYFALVIRFIRLAEVLPKDWLSLASAGLLCTLIYPFFAIASLAVGTLAGVSLLLTRRWQLAFGMMGITGASALTLAFLLLHSHAGEAGAMRFASSLPMLAPSLLYGIALFSIFAWIFRRTLWNDTEIVFALSCLLTPVILMNQQVVTGVMVQTLNWERYINYPFIVIGAAILFGKVNWAGRALQWSRVNAPQRTVCYATSTLMLVVLGLFLWSAQLRTYRQFSHYNLLTAAYSEATDRFYSERPQATRRVTLENASLDALVRLRTKTSGIEFNGYTDLVSSLKANGAAVPTLAVSVHRNWGFEHAARLGLSTAAYEMQLIAEVDGQACWPNLMFHFSFLECAPYVSDFRMYFPSKLKQIIPSIADAYQQYLSRQIDKRDLSRDALVLSTNLFRENEVGGLWRQELVGVVERSTKANGFAPSLKARVYAYWQQPLP